MLKRLLPAIVALLMIPAPAHAWGKTGHRITAAIAERFLDPRTRQGVRAILGVETLAEASTWPDFMRADPSEFWQETQ